MNVLEYIEAGWEKCIRENKQDKDTLFGLPYPYTVPCSDGVFQEMYYWDTYFTNKGLILSGRLNQAKNNTNNIAYLIKKLGFMPNGSRTSFLNRSQPPFFSEMVRDIYEKTNDKEWLAEMYSALEIEYSFWNTKRNTQIGLHQYLVNSDVNATFDVYELFKKRSGLELEENDRDKLTKSAWAMCESGWDFTPRWGLSAINFVQIDLNVLTYRLMQNLYLFGKECNISNAEIWKERADEHLKRIRKYMKNDSELFLDYNFVDNTFSEIFSAASFFPMAYMLATKDEAKTIVKNLSRIEESFGITACEEYETEGIYQWHYPNGWAPLQYIVVQGLVNYGYIDDAIRIANKYTNMVENVFEKNGNIWEKYNVREGSVNVVDEYDMPPMMGWSAGVYLYAKNLLSEIK
ncbi:MAG: alpha,alpha-trehalase [Clostridia bacterium]|nr:alpha,alpha-trehalase [Clostridia bacterium]